MQKHPFAHHVVLLIVGMLVFWGCSNDSANSYGTTSPQTPVAPPNTVLMVNTAFSPIEIRIAANTTITWKNDDGMIHTSTSDTGVWDTGDISPGASKTTTFTTAGTFPFHCARHAGMKGNIIVQ